MLGTFSQTAIEFAECLPVTAGAFGSDFSSWRMGEKKPLESGKDPEEGVFVWLRIGRPIQAFLFLECPSGIEEIRHVGQTQIPGDDGVYVVAVVIEAFTK